MILYLKLNLQTIEKLSLLLFRTFHVYLRYCREKSRSRISRKSMTELTVTPFEPRRSCYTGKWKPGLPKRSSHLEEKHTCRFLEDRIRPCVTRACRMNNKL